ncbi:MAG: ribosome biogenesis GTPase Der [Candidatus Cloacimonadales bacterium]|jgi:GTP-binding protein|nr:ribosome biogenesis GTPase Der [Candidatus Cloacimonadota bacterium]MDD2650566.1 ribosome biogenesis GTPase Der [Candidatus Cloacimonadota bacterium]MDD3500953.1 ribosome biogenesis GTPase Der [Candidatus Cloacimonadota bacterium]MDX9977494.1 ribosome biogenesis GTPase Der [Candidatus Cloacimonadales bacterium]
MIEKNKPIVAIVGRPNVGKSTLFNRLARKRSAIVDFEEGVTRDRKYEITEWNDRSFIIVDTGGIIPDSNLAIDKNIKLQAQIAIEQADLIIFLTDVKTGITDYDLEISKTLSTHRQKVLLVVNKVDNEKDELDLFEFYNLGFGDPFGIAANSGRNTGDFLDELTKILPDKYYDDEENQERVNVAIVGRPNTGKSSLINKIFGEEAVIVTDIAGTTRDSIDLDYRYEDKIIRFIDTAGLRKKSRIKYGVDYFSSMRTIDSIDRADIIILMLDASQEFSEQDQKIASYAQRKFKNMIILLNKWDLIEDKETNTYKEYVQKIRREFTFLEYVPIMSISALTGQRINRIPDMILKVWEESHKRISTSQLNDFMEKVIQKNPPSHSTGKHIKVYYVTQQATNPPTFIFFCNDPSLINVNYRRYIKNKIREAFKFEGATIKLILRGKEDDVPHIIY